MTTALVTEFEAILMETRERLLGDLHQFESEEREPQMVSGGSALRWGDGAEVASDVQEQESDFVQLNRLSRRLDLLDEALVLLREDPEAFGQCRWCGAEIPARRLRMVPWSRLCADCARGEAGEAEGA